MYFSNSIDTLLLVLQILKIISKNTFCSSNNNTVRLGDRYRKGENIKEQI